MFNITPHLHNKFELTLRRNGKVAGKAYAENVVLNNIWTAFADNLSDVNTFGGISFGTGSGTPSATDTAMFTSAFTYNIVEQVSRTIGYPTSTVVLKATLPATSEYTGTLTEIGLRTNIYYSSGGVYRSYLISHAMLKDAEGNPISIVKTDLDILEVTATVYCTVTSAVANFVLVSAGSNNILNAFSAVKRSSSSYQPFAPNSQGFLLAQTSVPAEDYASGVALSTSTSFNTASKILTYSIGRMVAGTGNTHYYNGMRFNGWGHVRFPNATFFPAYTISDMSVGTGDGETTEFKSPLNLFVENSETVYLNGVAMARGTNYTIDHRANIDKLVTASAGNRANFTQLADSFSGATPDTYRFFGMGYTSNKFFLSANKPLILKLDSSDATIGTRVNTVSLGYISLVGFTGYSHAGLRFIISRSDDGNTWTEVGSINVTATSTSTKYGDLTFTATDSEYWKIEVDITGISNATVKAAAATRPFYQTTAGMTFLGYVGSNIRFINPPAKDTIITMSASVDRPFKNSNFVIDMSASLGFAGG